MSWSAEEQREVKRALVGSWPGTITQWGRDAFAAYVGELEARGLEAESVLLAVRTWPAGSDFPPSAPNLAAQARKDPSRPSFDEAWALIRVCLKARTAERKTIWGLGERDRLDEVAQMERAREPDIHPLIAPFMARQGGPARLGALDLDSPTNEFREVRRRELAAAWAQFLEDTEGREIATLASGARREQIGRFDPLAALGARRAEIAEESS